MAMKLSEVMSTDVEVVGPEATLAEAAEKMRQLEVGILPVCDGDTLLGVLTDRDITVRGVAAGADPNTMTVQQTMTQDLVYCFDDQDIRTAATLREGNQLRRLVIIDGDKKLVC